MFCAPDPSSEVLVAVQDYQGSRMPCGNSSEHSNPDCVCMPCQCCPRWHHVYVTKRPRHAAYYCRACQR